MFQTFKDLNRLREIAALALRHGFGEMLDRTRLWEILGRREKAEVRPESGRETTARRFRLLLSDLGPTFIKLGQILSTRADILPREYVQELASLQDAVPPEPMEHVLKEIEQSLGKPASELFASVDDKPLASASIAQVHRARTLDGEDMNQLDTFAAVERLIKFYVEQHNSVMPHSAFKGQTPDEIYFGKGMTIPDELAAAREVARAARIAANKAISCEQCRPDLTHAATSTGPPDSAGNPSVLHLHTPDSRMS